jgi:hypothetical protein
LSRLVRERESDRVEYSTVVNRLESQLKEVTEQGVRSNELWERQVTELKGMVEQQAT